MRSVNKRLDLETAYRTAERCARVGIRPSFNLIFGLPAEEEEDLRDTMAVVDRIGRANPEADFFTNIFSPYPGSPIWPLAVERGVREPQTLEEWAAFYPEGPGAALAARAARTPASSASATTSASATRRARWWWRRRAG